MAECAFEILAKILAQTEELHSKLKLTPPFGPFSSSLPYSSLRRQQATVNLYTVPAVISCFMCLGSNRKY
jgi:hypothetical protein